MLEEEKEEIKDLLWINLSRHCGFIVPLQSYRMTDFQSFPTDLEEKDGGPARGRVLLTKVLKPNMIKVRSNVVRSLIIFMVLL